MDIEKKRRRQSLKVILSEAIMVFTMVITVLILALVVSGYWINPDFTVERQGMLQISSMPSGADVYIDGETSWFQKTSTSKILSSGEHTISLSKEGYDSWSRTINITEGLLYRIHYPRLFLQERTPETVLDVSKYTAATVSPNSKIMVLLNGTTEWTILKLDSDTIKPEKLNITSAFFDSATTTTEPKLLTSEILSYNWDKNNEHILLKTKTADGDSEWILLDITNVKDSLNLTREFGVNFASVEIIDNSSSNLLAVNEGNLYKIDTRHKTISANLVKNIISFDHYDSEVVFSALNAEEKYYLGTITLGDPKVTELDTFSDPVKTVILQFYEDKYIATLNKNTLTLHEKDNYEQNSDYELSFTPSRMKVGARGEFITMTSGNNIATLDMEDKTVREWHPDGSSFGWLDDEMIYSVKDGELIVYDFDGLNRRVLVAKNVSSHFPVKITNNKWLYYFSDGELIREKITR